MLKAIAYLVISIVFLAFVLSLVWLDREYKISLIQTAIERSQP